MRPLRNLAIVVVSFLGGYAAVDWSRQGFQLEPMANGPAMALSVVFALVAFPVFLVSLFRRAIRKQAYVELEETTWETLSQSLRESVTELEALGFSRSDPPVSTANDPKLRWQALRSSDGTCISSLSERGPGFSVRSSDFDSLLSDGRWLMTMSDPSSISMPTHSGFIIQACPGMPIPELFRRHQEALRALGSAGVFAQLPPRDYLSLTQTMMRDLYSDVSLASAGTVLWRSLTRRSPHLIPVAARAR